MNLSKKIISLLFILNVAFAQLISIQGIARDNSGASLKDGDHTITFRLYKALSGGNAVWSEAQTLKVVNGVFSTNLGSETSMSSLNFNDKYFLSLEIGSNGELSPRSPLTMTPYAIMAQLDGSTNVIPASGKVGFGTTSPDQQLHVKGKAKIESDIRLEHDDSQTGYIIHPRSNANYDKLYIAPKIAGKDEWSKGITLRQDGRLGVGTGDPTDKLHVDGKVRIDQNGTGLTIVGDDHSKIHLMPRGTSQGAQGVLGWLSKNSTVMYIKGMLGDVRIDAKPGNKVYTTNNFEAPNIMYIVDKKSSSNFSSKEINFSGINLDKDKKYKLFFTVYADGKSDSHFYIRLNNDTRSNIHRGESMCKFWGSGEYPNNVGNSGVTLGRQGWSQGGYVSGEVTIQRYRNGNGASVNGKIGISATNPVNCTSYGRFGSGTNVTSIKLISTQINFKDGELTLYALPH